MTTAADVLTIARSQIGSKESPAGSNRQPYGAAIGLNGVAWCAIFQWWTFMRCGIDLRAVLKLGTGPMSYCPAVAQAFKARGWWHTWPDARPGDLVFYSWNGGRTIEHVGMVEVIGPVPGFIAAIEGNTATGNDANGGQVMRRIRDHNAIVGFGRFPFAQLAPQPAPAPAPVYVEDDMQMVRTPDGEIDLEIAGSLIHLDEPGHKFYKDQGVPQKEIRQQDGDIARAEARARRGA